MDRKIVLLLARITENGKPHDTDRYIHNTEHNSYCKWYELFLICKWIWNF